MTVPKINSAHGSDTRNVINRAIEVLNRLGIDVQTLVAEGQLTEEQYAELITVINGLIKSGHVDKSDLSSEFKDEIEGFSAQLAQKANENDVYLKSEQININDFDEPTRQTFLEAQGIDVNYVLGNGNVKPYNTTFFKPVNHFNKDSSENVYDAYMTGSGSNTFTGYMYTHKIPVKNGDVIYVVSGYFDTFRGILLDGAGTIIQQIRGSTEGVITSDGYYSFTVNNPDTEYIIINLGKEYEDVTMVTINQEINDGNKSDYIAYNGLKFILNENIGVELSDENKSEILKGVSISPEQTTFIKSSSNLFNKNDENIENDVWLTTSEGGDTAPKINSSVTGFIPIVYGKTYSYSADYAIYGTIRNVAWYDETKELIEITRAEYDSGNNYLSVTVTNPNAKFLRVNVSTRTINEFMFNEGATLKPYEDYGVFLSPSITTTMKDNNRDEINEIIDKNSRFYEKTALYNGDSICRGDGFMSGDKIEPRANTGWATIIQESNSGMTSYGYGVSGGTIAAETYTSGGDPKHWICRDIENMEQDADYIIFQGGFNDMDVNVPIGVITSGYDDTLDDETFAGALESVFKQATLKWQGKKIGFIITFKARSVNHQQTTQTEFWDVAREICKKWSIPYLDLFNEGGLNCNLDAINTNFFASGDKLHPNERGYREYLAPKIEAWMKTL